MRTPPLVALCFAVVCHTARVCADDAMPGIDQLQDQVQGIYEVCQAAHESAKWSLCVGYIDLVSFRRSSYPQKLHLAAAIGQPQSKE